MGRALRGWVVAAAVCAAVPAQAAAGTWNQPLTVAPSGHPGGVGVDGAGNTTILYSDGERRWFAATRPAGATGFGTPAQVAPQGSLAALAVTPQGRVILAYQDEGITGGQLWYRTGVDVNSLSGAIPLGERAVNYMPRSFRLVVGGGGHALASWTDPATGGAPPGTSHVATMEPGGRFGPPQRLEDGPREVSVAINGRGDAVAAWTDDAADVARAAYRPSGGVFGAPQELGPGAITNEATAVDPTGAATVLVHRRDVLRAARTTAGVFAPPRQVGEGVWGRLVNNPGGPAVAMWTTLAPNEDWREAGARTLNVAAQQPDGSFAPPRVLDSIPASLEPMVQVDPIGNLVTVFGTGRFGSGPIFGAVLSRFDLTASERSPRLTPEYVSGPASMALGPHGHVATMYGDFPSFGGDDRPGAVRLLERRPDVTAPGVALVTSTRSMGRLAARVRCTESCQVVARLTAYAAGPQRRKARRSKPVASRAVVLRGRRKGRLAITLPSKERKRLRKLVGRRHTVRTVVAVSAQDAWGNPRIVRRRVSAKRLLR